MIKVTIVYPPFGVVENQPNIKAVAENYGVFPCLSLVYVAAVFESCGCEVQFIDANALSLSKKEVLKLVKNFNPDLLCFTITTYLFHQTLDWVKYLKQNTGIRIVVGGMHLSLYAKETLTNEWIDYALVGEAETVLPNFIKALSKNKGFNSAEGRILITLDGDLQNDPLDIPKLIKGLNNYDVVCGWRYNRKDSFLIKKLPSNIFNLIVSVLFGIKIHDSSCTLKAYKKHAINSILPLKEGDHRFIPVLLFIKGYNIGEVKVEHNVRKYGEAKYNSPLRFLQGLKTMLRIKFMYLL